MSPEWLLIVAFCAMVLAYGIYGIEQRRGLIEPNRASWMIWSVANASEALTYNALNSGAAQNAIFFVSSAACLLITISVWRHGALRRPTTLESVTMAASLLALILWLGWQHTAWAHWLLVIMVPVSFLPTWISVLKDRASEQSAAWGLWTISDLAILAFVLQSASGRGTDLPYVTMELFCHASVWALIGFATLNPVRSLRWNNGQIMVKVAEHKAGGAIFLVGRNRLGKAVYSGRAYQEGQRIIAFTGPIVTRAEIQVPLVASDDRYVQVGPGQFMGPSGGVDDLINHSCDPNCGLKFMQDGPYLIAIRPIAAGEELTWDYSTTVVADDWSMQCFCGVPQCRGVIGDFRDLPPQIKARYQWLGIIPDYACETITDQVA
jgi:hypothetical protein